MRKRLFLLILITARFFAPGDLKSQNGPPWVKTNVGYNYIMRSIDFPGNQDLVGYMAGESLTYNGNGIVLKTTDGGNTWVPKWNGTNMGIEGACFTDENTGFIAGWPNLANGWSGFGKTTDGGNNWTSPAVTPDLYYFTDVVFKDALNGILLGATNSQPMVYVTNNGGTSWTPASGISNVPYHGCYVSGNTYFLADNAGNIRKSVNNGLTWTTVYSIPGGLLTGIDFYNDNIGMACGDNGLIVRTSDGGTTWQVQVIGTDIWHDFGWQDQEHLFCCGTPEIVAESVDGGSTWGNGFPGSSFQAALYECTFTGNGSGFICGSQGTLLKRQPSCTAGFTASQTEVCTGEPVTFTNQAVGNISTWDWYFEGGSPSTSSDPDPEVTYSIPGTWDVQLIVNNGYWSDTLLKKDYMVVTDPATPVISVTGLQLSSNVVSGNQWYLDGAIINGATGQTHLATQSGWYWDVVTQNGCVSDTSNNIRVIMTGWQEGDGAQPKISQVPGTGIIRLNLDSPFVGSCTVLIFNSLGAEIYSGKWVGKTATTTNELNLGPVSPGIYVLMLDNGTTHYNLKFVLRAI